MLGDFTELIKHCARCPFRAGFQAVIIALAFMNDGYV